MHPISLPEQLSDLSEILPSSPYVKYLPEPTSSLKELVRRATGKLYHVLTNDYLFRALLQENNEVLKGLICSVLHLSPNRIHSVTITNPILLGKDLGKKTFFLDINILLNDNTKSAIHISFLDYTLFPASPSFHSVYKLKDEKNCTIYTDKFSIHVINLTRIDLATEEDRFYGTDQWASFFKAKTWEEINMLAKQKSLFESAAETIYQLDNDPQIRWLCDAYNATLARERYYHNTLAEKDAEIDSQKAEIERLKALLAEQSRS